jgi:hypothetical protein
MGSDAILTARLITCAKEDENELLPVKLPALLVDAITLLKNS